jgi:putative nucleotidyltransferase with HDIG domain
MGRKKTDSVFVRDLLRTLHAPRRHGLMMARMPEALKAIPAFPRVIARLLRTLSDGDSAFSEIVDLIECDTALTSEVLALANSSLYCVTTNKLSVPRAVVLLGVDRIRTLSSALALRSIVVSADGHDLLKRCWSHSVAVGVICAELASSIGWTSSQAYTAGLLHDVGRLGLMAAEWKTYRKVEASRYHKHGDILLAERAATGIDHCEAGLILVVHWELPGELVSVAARHHDPGSEDDLTVLVRSACSLADALGFAVIPYECQPDYAAVLKELGMKRSDRLVADRLHQRVLTEMDWVDRLLAV